MYPPIRTLSAEEARFCYHVRMTATVGMIASIILAGLIAQGYGDTLTKEEEEALSLTVPGERRIISNDVDRERVIELLREVALGRLRMIGQSMPYRWMAQFTLLELGDHEMIQDTLQATIDGVTGNARPSPWPDGYGRIFEYDVKTHPSLIVDLAPVFTRDELIWSAPVPDVVGSSSSIYAAQYAILIAINERRFSKEVRRIFPHFWQLFLRLNDSRSFFAAFVCCL